MTAPKLTAAQRHGLENIRRFGDSILPDEELYADADDIALMVDEEELYFNGWIEYVDGGVTRLTDAGRAALEGAK